ncbi:MAG: transglutaminase family protein [Kiritimatiellae bacterium]|nr:transglutaminase family protein [Kiritimatiellia bacterium]MDW8459243.1 transglutaminase family protein [Verrucomicrobiota bacterium]
MLFNVRHTTLYRYSAPALLGPHVLRLCPQQAPGVRVIRWSIDIRPKPVGETDYIDDAGNFVHAAWFAGSTESLSIATSIEARTIPRNPFDFIVTNPGALVLPAKLDHARLLAPYLKPVQQSGAVARLSAKLAKQAGSRTLEFLRIAAEHLAGFHKTIREEGPPQPPSKTLASQTGACRDLTVLFMDLCRWQGLPARFVSGYWRGRRPVDRHHLHAWAEVYLPGAGWRGYDPTCGLAVSDEHLPLAAAPAPEGAAPVEGTYGGGAIESTLSWQIRIDVRP